MPFFALLKEFRMTKSHFFFPAGMTCPGDGANEWYQMYGAIFHFVFAARKFLAKISFWRKNEMIVSHITCRTMNDCSIGFRTSCNFSVHFSARIFSISFSNINILFAANELLRTNSVGECVEDQLKYMMRDEFLNEIQKIESRCDQSDVNCVVENTEIR